MGIRQTIAAARSGAVTRSLETMLKAKRPFAASLLVFILLSLGIGLAGYVYYLALERQIREQQSDELTSVVNLKILEIIHWRSERMQDARLVQHNGPVIRRIRDYLSNPSAVAAREEFAVWLDAIQHVKEYESVVLLDTENRVRAAFGPRAGTIGDVTRSLAARALASGKAHFSDLRRGEANGIIRWDIFVPLHVTEGGREIPVGVVILRTDPHNFLYPLLQSWSKPSATAETLLVRRDGDRVLFLNELRHRKGTALRLHLPADTPLLPAAAAARGEEGVLEGRDYRGVPVLAAVRTVPGTNMYMIAKIDTGEIYSTLRRQAWMILLIVTVMIVLAGAWIMLVLRSRQVESYEALYESELARRDLHQRYESITRDANDIILLSDADRRLVEVNERAIRTYGYTREEMLAMTTGELRQPEASPPEAAGGPESSPDGLVYEETHLRKDGTALPVEVSRRTVDIGGKPHHLEIIRDITERRRHEEALSLSAERLDIAQAAANAGVWDWDLSTGTLEWTAHMFTLFGLDPSRATASFEAWRSVLHPDDRQPAEDRIRRALEERTNLDSDYRVILPDGEVRWINALGSGEYGPDGKPRRMTGLCIDVTERRRVRRMLEEAEMKYRIVADNTHDWEFWVRPDGRFVYNSPSCERISGYTPADFDASPGLLSRIVHPEDRPLYFGHLRDDVATHRPGNVTFRIVRRDGEVRWIEHVCQAIVGEDGVSLGQRGSNRDITGRKEAEETLRRRTEQLEEANRELESFSYSISHDLRAPLRAIDGFSRMLLKNADGDPDRERLRKLQVIRENAQRMGRLIDDLLAFSHLGRQAMNYADLDMNTLVSDAWAEQTAADSDHRAELAAASLPEAFGDAALVRVVLANLLSNAIKYSRSRERPVVTIAGKIEGAESVYSVADNGVGFDMRYYDKLFGVFQRLHSSDEYEGTGVGLAIAQRAVQRHGGRIWAEAELEGGATFHFTLPVRGR